VEGAVSAGPLHAQMVVVQSQTFTLEVDLYIEEGKTVALLGPNGAGKTTTVSAIVGLSPITRGHIRLGPEVLDDPANGVFVLPERRRIGTVFQDYLLFPHLSVVENIAFGLRSHGSGRAEATARARDWAGRMGLGGTEDLRPGELSGGQAQRVAVGRALAIEPDLLLLDEPLAALDVTTRVALRRTLADHLRDFEGPRLLITHDPTEAFLLADEICVIEEGVITQVGNAEEIRLRPKTRYAADLAGSNLISGVAGGGRVDTGSQELHIANHDVSGRVLLTVRPNSISLHRSQPEGSQRNTWATTVQVVEHLGDRVRVGTSGPLPLTVEVTKEASESLGLHGGLAVWVAVKATEIGVEPQA
jgi:molybdate transport system ATP-binding protein